MKLLRGPNYKNKVNMKKIISFGLALGVVFPSLAFAADAFSVIAVITNILNRVIPVLIILAVVYFIWGVIQYTVAQDEEKKKKSRSAIIHGLVGLFVIVTFWGIIHLIQNTFLVGNERLDAGAVPCIPVPSAGVTCP
jgi:hypothetical protein